jgi:hypothetical protein
LLELIKLNCQEWDEFTKEGEARYFISNMKELEELISLLDKNPLLTRKWSDYLLFKSVGVSGQ